MRYLPVLLLLPALTLASPTTRPAIQKLGTLECDMVETTPVVFHGRLQLVEYVRENYQHHAPNHPGPYLRVTDIASNSHSAPFAEGYHLCSALVDQDTLHVFAVDKWGSPRIQHFSTTDLKTWQTRTALDLPGWRIFNTSVCRANGRYVMAIEIDATAAETGVPFTIRFAESKDLSTWTLTPSQCVFSKDRYTACPTLRYLPDDGRFYMVYLEQRPGPNYQEYIARSPDLATWELSPLNPVLVNSDDDRKIANPTLTPAERQRIATAANLNNSDIDFCEFNGDVFITYSWGNQTGIEHLATARSPGTLPHFLKSYFPTPAQP